jgi:rhodanese-related sulfurtransferase
LTDTITRDELVNAVLDREATLVETLRAEHFADGHLPGAIHIHYEQAQERAADLLPDKDALIVTYCSNADCQNSDIAAKTLRELGYTNVRRYVEGKQDWVAAGLALEVEKAAAL